jgi:hypothetical protein
MRLSALTEIEQDFHAYGLAVLVISEAVSVFLHSASPGTVTDSSAVQDRARAGKVEEAVFDLKVVPSSRPGEDRVET